MSPRLSKPRPHRWPKLHVLPLTNRDRRDDGGFAVLGVMLHPGLWPSAGREFTVFEASRDLPRSARRITAAGRDAGQPAFLALGLGGGIVLRAGTPQWARELEESALSLELPIVTKRIWRLLSAGGSS